MSAVGSRWGTRRGRWRVHADGGGKTGQLVGGFSLAWLKS